VNRKNPQISKEAPIKFRPVCDAVLQRQAECDFYYLRLSCTMLERAKTFQLQYFKILAIQLC